MAYSDFGNEGPAFSERTVKEMTIRQYFAGQALANPSICTGKAHEYELRNWFGDKTGITAAQIVKKQAFAYADEMMRG